MNSVHPHSKSGSRRKASVITHHDHTRQIVDKLAPTGGRFEWTLQSLFSEIPLLRRSRASKAVDMTDEEDDMLFYRGYTHGLWNMMSKAMDRGICTIACVLALFLVYRIVDLYVSLRDEKEAQFPSLDDPESMLSADYNVQHIFADIKWIVIESTSIVSMVLIHFVLKRARVYHAKHKSRHHTQFPHTPLSFAVPIGCATFLSLAVCMLSHTGITVHVELETDTAGQPTFTTRVVGSVVFRRPLSQKSMFVLSSLSQAPSDSVLVLPHTAYLKISDADSAVPPLGSGRRIDLENSEQFTKWMINHVAVGFRMAFLFFLSVLLPLFITPRWREVCVMHALNLCAWVFLAVAVFLRYSTTSVAPAVMLVISMLLSFLVAFFVTMMLPLVAAMLYEQSQQVDANRKELFRWSFHEVRVPCTAILSGVNMLVNDNQVIEALDSDAQNSLFDVALSTRQLSNVLNNVLEWERSSQMGMTLQSGPVQLGFLLRESLGIFETAAKSHNLRVGIEYPLHAKRMHSVEVVLDQQKMHHILLNMMSNCVKHARTHITVHVCVLPLDACATILAAPLTGQLCTSVTTPQEAVSVPMPKCTHAHNSVLIIQILDDGPGMSSSILHSYSQQFVMDTTSNAGASIRNTGTGLGAHISARMLQAHGGQMFLRSSKDVGTAVTLLVPVSMSTEQLRKVWTLGWQHLALQDPELFLSGHTSIREPNGALLPALWRTAKHSRTVQLAISQSTSSPKSLPGSPDVKPVNPLVGRNVLLVEDDKLVVRVLQRCLAKAGAHVWTAMNGSEALCMLAKACAVDDEALASDLAVARAWEEAGASSAASQSKGADPMHGGGIRSASITTAIDTHLVQKWREWGVSQARQPWKPHQTSAPCPQHFDLVLTDMNMPHLSGLSVCAMVQRWRQDRNVQTTVVGLTGNALDEDLRMFVHHGADHALAKPLQLGILQTYLHTQWKAHGRTFPIVSDSRTPG